jgi:predicted phosphodiesterase
VTPRWTDEQIETAKRILAGYTLAEHPAAVKAIAAATGRELTTSVLTAAFARRGLASPTSFLRPANRQGDADTAPADRTPSGYEVGSGGPIDPPAASPPPDPPTFAKLLDATRRGGLDFEQLCDRLELAPRKCRELVERAQAAGYTIDVAHNLVAFRMADADDRVRDLGIAPVVGQRQLVAIISDTHLGSKFCLREQLKDFVHMAYDRGVREILHPGDVLDGCYKHGVFELSHSGIDAQTEDLFETLPRLPGLTYHGICGNHDDTFSDKIGIDAGQFMQNWFQARGRNDLRFYGRRGAYLRIRGATVELWHPKKGAGYALSYQLQNHIRDYGVGQKPDILLAGHWHTYVYLEQRGVHALACGTFQGSRSAFSKSIGGAPSIGGTLLSWDVTADGTLRRLSVERSSYFEHEQPQELLA